MTKGKIYLNNGSEIWLDTDKGAWQKVRGCSTKLLWVEDNTLEDVS